MKISIERKKLADALAKVSSIVESRNTIPILSNILLIAEGSSLTLTSTNLDASATVLIDGVNVEQQGKTTIEAKVLSSLVARLKGTECSIHANDVEATIKSGRSRLKVAVLPAEDWPEAHATNYENTITMNQQDLKYYFDSIGYAASNEETRFFLNGIFMHSDAGRINMVATNGHILSCISTVEGDMPYGIIIPSKTVTEAIKLCTDDSEVNISYSDRSIKFDLGDVTLQSKLIEGTYPDYQRVIPSGYELQATVDYKSLIDSVNTVATISDKKNFSVRLKFSNDSITTRVIGSSNAGEDHIDADCNFEMEVGLNPAYIVSALSKIKEEVNIFVKDDNSPVLFHPNADTRYKTVIMPMRF